MTYFASRYFSLRCILCLLLGKKRGNRPISIVLCLACFTLFFAFAECSFAVNVEIKVGADITLTCKYDARYYGKLSVCWGRGPLPSRGCANEVIKTDGTSVTSRSSERYLLMGNIVEGDVSLTIRQVVESDSGVYGCRVEIPGWFNDRKHQMSLMVVPGESQIAVDCTVK